MIACRYAEKYKAKKYPRCNKGNPCQICLLKWEIAEMKKEYWRDRFYL